MNAIQLMQTRYFKGGLNRKYSKGYPIEVAYKKNSVQNTVHHILFLITTILFNNYFNGVPKKFNDFTVSEPT